MPDSLRHLFSLDAGQVHLNHGSFGAVPLPVQAALEQWQQTLISRPNAFMFRECEEALARSLAALAGYLGTSVDQLVFVDNATTGMNIVVRSLALQPGDEILTTAHEYGAVNRLLKFVAAHTGAVIKIQPIPEPLTTPEAFVEAFMSGVTTGTRLITLSHITAPTALRFPVKEICRQARERGIMTLIDGAHVPGMIDLNLDRIGADFYTGNCHKWLCAPMGSAFLYARPDVQQLLQPLVVSWGYESETPSASTFKDYFGWVGTKNPAACLAVEAAVKFQREVVTDDDRRRCSDLALEGWHALQSLLGQQPLCENPEVWLTRMAAVQLPPHADGADWLRRLWQEFKIESVIRQWEGRWLLRLSVQVYNDQSDIKRLLDAVEILNKA